MKKTKQCISKLCAMILMIAMVFTAFTGLSGWSTVEAKAADGETVQVELADSIVEGEQYIFVGYTNAGSTNCALSTDNGQYASQRLAINVATNLSTPAYNPSYTDSGITEVVFDSEDDFNKCVWTAEAGSAAGTYSFIIGGKYLQSNYASAYWDTSTSYSSNWEFAEYSSGTGRHTLKRDTYYLSKTYSNSYFNLATSTGYAAGVYHVISDDPAQPHLTVNFNSNGGSAVEQQSVMAGKKVKEPETAQDGKIFKGWYSDEALTTAYDFDTAVNITEDSSITLYAKWADAVTVTFNTNGGSEAAAQTIEKGTVASQPENPTNSAADFVGWYSDEALTAAYDFTAAVNEDTTLYAKWKKQANVDVEVGTGTTSGYLTPFNTNYNNARTDMIYTADDIGTAGNIRAIAFNVNNIKSGGLATASINIYLGHTSDASFSGTNFSNSDLTLVYSSTGETIGSTAGWETFTFNENGGEFAYNGTDNLKVVICRKASVYASTPTYYYTAKTNQALYRRSDSDNTVADLTNTAAGTLANNLPNARFTVNTHTHNATMVDSWNWADDYSSCTVSLKCTEEGCNGEEQADGSFKVTEDAKVSSEVTAEPTCSATGTKVYTASYKLGDSTLTDQKTETLAIDPDAHNVTDWTVSADGETKSGVCTLCGETITVPNKSTWDGSASEEFTGAGTEEDPYLIDSAANLAYLAAQVNAGSSSNYAGKYFKQTINIDLNDKVWTPIGNSSKSFSGIYDGDGYTVSGLKVSGLTAAYQGLFGKVYGASATHAMIKNLVVQGSISAGVYNYIGGVAGYAGYTDFVNVGNEVNVTVTGSSSAGYYVGGIAGYAYYAGDFTDCYNKAAIGTNCTATYSQNGYGVGGILGFSAYAARTITNCYNLGAITGGTGNVVGGIIGSTGTSSSYSATLKNCYSNGTISGGYDNYKSDLVGYGYVAGTSSNNFYPAASSLRINGRDATDTAWAAKYTDNDALLEALGDEVNYQDGETANAAFNGEPALLWEPAPASVVKHTVTFNTNGGTETASKEVKDGKTFSKPDDPTKEGYLLAGWYKDSDLTQEWDFASDTVTEDITLYAKWGASHTVTFNTDGGTEVASIEVAEGAKISAPENVTKTNYHADGWYKDSAFETAWDFESDTVAGDMTLYLKWIENDPLRYKVIIADSLQPDEKYFITTTSLTDADGTGYALSRHRDVDNVSVEPVQIESIDGTLYISSNTEKGLEIENAMWDISTYSSGYRLATKNSSNATLYPQPLTAYATNLSLLAQISSYWTQTQTTDAGLPAVKLHWANSSSSSTWLNISEVSAALTGTGITRLYQYIDPSLAEYTVIFNANGGSAVDSVTGYETKKLTKPTDPEKDGYFFGGWYKDSDLTQEWNFATDTISGDITLYAKWNDAVTVDVKKATVLEAGKTYIITDEAGTCAMTSVAKSTNFLTPQDILLNATRDVISYPTEALRDTTIWTAGASETDGYATLTLGDNKLWHNNTYIRAAATAPSSYYVDSFRLDGGNLQSSYTSAYSTSPYAITYNTASVYFNAMIQDYATGTTKPAAVYEVVPAHEHNFVHHAAQDATCEESGNIEYWQCPECGKTYTDDAQTQKVAADSVIIPATGHDWEFTEFTFTETEDTENGGYTAAANYTCKNDGAHRQTVANTTVTDETTATCEEDGTRTYTAKVTSADSLDGTEHTGTKEVPDAAFGHDWDNGKITTQPTAAAHGVRTYTCKNDSSHTKTENLPTLCGENTDTNCTVPVTASPGSFVEGKQYMFILGSKAVSANETSYNAYGSTYLPALEGTALTAGDETGTWLFEDEDAMKAVIWTCTAGSASGKYSFKDADGNYIWFRSGNYDMKISAEQPTGNTDWSRDFVYVEESGSGYAATFSASNGGRIGAYTSEGTGFGRRYGNYAIVSLVDQENISGGAASHDLHTVQLPGCDNDLHTYWQCTVCGKLFADELGETEVADRSKHVLAHTEAIAPTCEETGNIEYWSCEVCGKIFSDEDGTQEIAEDETVLPAAGHDWEFTDFTWTGDDENGYTAAAANYQCRSDASHTKTVDASVTDEVTATCDAAGKKIYTAAVSAADSPDQLAHTDTKELDAAALGHTLTKTEAKAATCEEAGNTEYWTCEVCHKIFSDAEGTSEITVTDTVVSALGHDLTKTEAKEATCEEPGNIAYWTCTRCGKIFSDEQGTTEVTDTVIPAAGHTLQHVDTVPAACETDGVREHYECSSCGKWFSDAEGKHEVTAEALKLEATGHSWGEWVTTKEPTCTETGTAVRTCAACGNTEQKELPATGHSLTKTDAVAAACETDGNIEYYTCSVCGKLFRDADGTDEITLSDTVVSATGHDWGEWETAEPSTCILAGQEVRTCKNDPAHKEYREAALSAHKPVLTEAKEPTCTETGNTAYYTCEVCGKIFADESCTTEISMEDTVLPMIAHQYGEWIVVKEPTYDEEGLQERICSVCGDKQQETIAKLERTPIEEAQVQGLEDAVYTGEAISQTPVVMLGEKELVPEQDYTVSYENNTAVGIADVTVTGTGGYSGTLTAHFRILFKDVTDPEEQFYFDYVYWASDLGVVAGWSDGTFRPMNDCNRAAVVTFLWRLANKPEPSGIANFTDMPADTEANQDFRKAISWASEQGIVTGWDDGTFRPWNKCNRAAIVTFLWRYAGKPAAGTEASFTDMTGNAEFNQAISWASEKGITTGFDDNTFKPWNTCRRLAVVSFLYRMENE